MEFHNNSGRNAAREPTIKAQRGARRNAALEPTIKALISQGEKKAHRSGLKLNFVGLDELHAIP